MEDTDECEARLSELYKREECYMALERILRLIPIYDDRYLQICNESTVLEALLSDRQFYMKTIVESHQKHEHESLE